MNLRHIEIFHAIYLNGSVSAAARALNVSQPSVTKTLQHAERQLGFPLFLRQRGRLVPTEDAHSLFAEVADLHGRIAQLRQSSRNLRRGPGNILRVAALPAIALDLLPQAVAGFLERRPGTFFDLQTVHHDEVSRRLHERDCDAAIVSVVPRGLPLAQRRLGEGKVGILYRRQDLPAAPARIALADIADRPFVSMIRSGPIGDLLASEAERLGIEFDDVAAARTFYVAAGLVRAGVGLAAVDSFTAAALCDATIDFRPLQPPLTFDVFAITLESRPPSVLMTEFLDAVAARIVKP